MCNGDGTNPSGTPTFYAAICPGRWCVLAETLNADIFISHSGQDKWLRGFATQACRLAKTAIDDTLSRVNPVSICVSGWRRVRGEFSLTALAYNLRRVLNVVELPKLIVALPA